MDCPDTWFAPDAAPRLTLFFQKFREAVARLPAGLIRPGPAAASATIGGVARELGAALPAAYVGFLESFDGAVLFHEAVLLGGAGASAPRSLLDLNPQRPVDELVFGEATGGDRFAFHADGRILRLRSESEERWIAGGDFSRWLDGMVAYHRVLYGPDGEFAPDAFEEDGGDVVPVVALRQAERALRACPDSADWQHERGVALRRLGRLAAAREAFTEAAGLDTENPWPLFSLGRTALDEGAGLARVAGTAFESAARRERGGAAGRLWVWAARAALLQASPERLVFCRHQALLREPDLAAQLRRARDAAAHDDGEPDEIAEAEALLDALEAPVQPGRVRLPVMRADAPPATPPARKAGDARRRVSGGPARPARRTPPPGPRRPDPAAPRPAGARRPARSR